MNTLIAAITTIALSLAVAPAALAQSNGPVAAYGFEEATGSTAIDSAAGLNPGTLSGPTRSASGRFGSALSFDGVNDRVNVADSASFDLTVGMTLEAWVRPDSGGWRTALMKERPGGIAYALYASTDTNRPSAEIHAETRGTSSLPGGTWSHLATTYDGATLRLYVNGTQVSSRAVTGVIAVSSGALRIGGNAVWGEYFAGLIDEVRVYNRALTAGDIQADMGRAVVAAGDTQAPTAPILTGTAAGDDVHLSWTASTDNVGVKEYRVYRDGTLVGTRAGTAARELDDSDRPNGTYRYTVVAADDAGNASAASNESVLVIDLDTTAPSVSVGTTCGGTVYDSQQMRSTWGDDRGPVTIRIEVDGQTVYGPILISGTSGTILWLWNTRAQTNGTHVMRAIARDAAGNETVSDACEFSVQNKVLTVPITSLNDGQTVSGTVRIKVEPRADGEPLTYRPVSVALLPSGPGMNPPGVTVGPGIYEWTWDTTQAENREYALTSALYFEDTGGPQVTNTIRVTVDNAVPKPTGLTADVGFNGRDVELHWNWVDGIYDYNVYRDGVKILNTSANYAGDSDVPPGTHRYTVTAVRGGNESAPSDETVVIVDGNTPPTAPWLTGTVTVDDAHLSWEPSSDNVGVKEYRVYRDGTLIATRGRSTLVYDDMNRPAGTYRYKVVAVDDVGLTGTSREVSLTIDPDTTPPTISVGGICGGATVHDYATLRPSWGDDRGTVTYRIEVDGQPVFGPYTGGPGSTFWDWETRGLSNGMHVMKGYARDAAGNETVTADCEWNVHNPVLTVPLSSPTDGETVSGTVTLTAEPRADGSPMATGYPIIAVGFSVDGAGFSSDTSGPYQATWDTTKVANGLHTITTSLYWMDYGGTRGTTTTQVRVENTLPRPTGLAATVTGDDVALNWNAVIGATEYRVFRGSDRIATVTGTSYTDANRPVGTHHYTVVAANAAGVTSGPSDEATATIAGDTTPPTITLQAVCDGRALSEYVGPINGTVSDDSGAPVTVNVDVEDQHLFGPQSVNGAFNFSWDTRKNANGPVVMKVTARDAAGNETVKDCPWTVSNRALSVPITAPADGATISGPVTVDFRPLADGSPTSAPVRLYIDGTLVSDGFTYTYAWDTTKVANGLHTIKADMLWQGYTQVMATSTIQVRVENTAPAPPTGLVAAYGFEETSGTTVTDSSGKGSTGTIAGATSAAGGKFGRALSFDGVNDLVTVPDSNALDLAPGMTLEAWVKPTSVTDWRTVLLKERPGQLVYALYASADNGRPMTEVTAASQREARGTAALPVGTWSHLAATYDRTTLRLYVNGTQVATGAVSGALLNSTGALRIGGNNVWGEWFSGLIDEVRVYERALSATEIQADRDRAVVPGT